MCVRRHVHDAPEPPEGSSSIGSSTCTATRWATPRPCAARTKFSSRRLRGRFACHFLQPFVVFLTCSGFDTHSVTLCIVAPCRHKRAGVASLDIPAVGLRCTWKCLFSPSKAPFVGRGLPYPRFAVVLMLKCSRQRCLFSLSQGTSG